MKPVVPTVRPVGSTVRPVGRRVRLIALAGAATALAAGCATSTGSGRPGAAQGADTGAASVRDAPPSAALVHSLSPRPVSGQPGRPTAEIVPESTGTVEIVTDAASAAGNGPSDTAPITILPPTSARSLVHDFDELPVLTGGSRRCPAAGRTDTVSFRADGHTWTATSGGCRGVAVSLDGHALPALAPSVAFAQDLHRALGPAGPNLALVPPAR